ncbi:MAG: PIN domain nuclease, partial [Desulfomonilaceae bacterium]|nr:PIN domain nuclease [Desulfomonilaceae bacterium]
MPGKLISAVLVLSCLSFSVLIGHSLFGNHIWTAGSAVLGILLGLGVVTLVRVWLREDVYKIVGGAVGAIGGALLAVTIGSGFQYAIETKELSALLSGMTLLVLMLVGLQLGATKGSELKSKSAHVPSDHRRIVGILDTSVIIDGRIADVCETGFLGGDLIIPEFVLQELQMIADSADTTKRTRGRRGLDVLNKIRKQSYVDIIIEDKDYPDIKEVDQKLITMARDTGHALLTNDFNLNKVAEVHSIQVLNMNRLANALKPVVLPGEIMRVQILKEGKEAGQGVAY